jgi:hypothetical protein
MSRFRTIYNFATKHARERRNAKSLWLSQWEFSENNSKWPMFSDTYFSHWKTDLEKKPVAIASKDMYETTIF